MTWFAWLLRLLPRAAVRRPSPTSRRSGLWRCLLTALFSMTLLAACVAPSPASRAADAARDLNLAARFGRMDVAANATAESARAAFLERRANWGRALRVLDVELTGFSMIDRDDANVQVDYAWVRLDEDVLRVTRVAQTWADRGKGWQLVTEQRLSGDSGLFGELPARSNEPRPDVHFPTKTLHY